ncbi:MAG TPA: PilT/PilU family type 4a pilus ATPase [Acidimicrobiales bacterium]|nr:PilT/PilU family type 4a pilus ATPase [Acidimicrobiales bacterium]
MSNLLEIMRADGLVDERGIAEADRLRREQGLPLATALVRAGAATERAVAEAVAKQMGKPFVDTTPGNVDPAAAALVPRSLALELEALPVAFDGTDELVVAVSGPKGVDAANRIAELTGMRTALAVTPRGDLVRAIEHLADELDVARPAPAGPGRGAGAANAPRPSTAPPPSGAQMLAYEQEGGVDLDEVLTRLVNEGGSDLHLTTGSPPALRIRGEVVRLQEYGELAAQDLQKMIYSILTQRQREAFEKELELDLSYTVPGRSRFRVNVFRQRDAVGAVMRVIPFEIKPLEALGVPASVATFARLPRGFVLVTGPTGSGKSTTLASLIDLVNRESAGHIMTVEDPIEFLHSHKRCVVNQRELGTDTRSFAAALKHALRQDPDVILVGEMRDLETIQVALTAAETGHLVFGTLHTQDAPQSVDRLIDVFPPSQQEQIRVMIAGTLQGVVCQQLLPTADGKGRAVACEVMVATSAIRNLIREAKTHQMYSAIQAGKQYGMVTMDQSLADLVRAGRVTYEAALERANNPPEFVQLAGKAR